MAALGTQLLLLFLFSATIASVYSISIAIRDDPFAAGERSSVVGIDVGQSLFDQFFELSTVLLLWPLLLVIGVSLKLCLGHIKNYNNPKEQGPIIAIAALPSMYAICSYIGLLLTNSSVITMTLLDGITEAYSAFTMIMFYQLLYAYLENGDMDLMHGQRVFRNLFPFTLFQPYEVPINRQTIRLYRVFVIQYLVLRLFGLAVLTMFHVPAYAIKFFDKVSFASGSIAVLAIVIFFKSVRVDISANDPDRKLLCLKVSVLFSFTQVYIIWILQLTGFLDSSRSLFNIQNVLLLVEMVPYSLYVVSCYPCAPYCQRASTVQIEVDDTSDEEHES